MNIILNSYFIPRYGIAGAATATALSLIAKNLLAVIFVKRKLGISVII
jgi:O-antigen/teichoic acid export membrane protein